MKNLFKNTIAIILLIAAFNLNAFDAVSTLTQVNFAPIVQNITLDGDQQSFIVPHDGTYIISFKANVINPGNINALVTIRAYVNNTPANAVTTVQVPARSAQAMPINFSGTLELKEKDVVQFKWSATRPQVSLQPVNGSPSFEVTINPEKPWIKL